MTYDAWICVCGAQYDKPGADCEVCASRRVDHPPHYRTGDIECWDAIRAALGPDGFKSYCRGNALKYIWRAPYKGDEAGDYGKAVAYLLRIVGGGL